MKKLIVITSLFLSLLSLCGCDCKHMMVVDSGIAATCTEDGISEGRHCELCGKVFVEQTIVPKLGHNIVTIPGIEPTCTQEGLTAGCYCSNCGEVFVKQEKIPAKQHSIVVDDGIEPTCAHYGLTKGCHCSCCGEVFVKQEKIAKKDHIVVVDKRVEATCTSTGLTEGSHCKECGEVLEEQEVIPMKEHNVVYQEGYEPTKTSVGLTDGAYCKDCGTILKKQEVIPMITKKTITFTADSNKGFIVGLPSQTVYQKETTKSVSAFGKFGYKFIGWSNGSTERDLVITVSEDETIEALFVDDQYKMPLININTENKKSITSKEEWVKCDVSTSLCEEKYVVTGLTGKIKGRGNSTWGMPKKPYKFKLDEKANILGLGKAKNWVLLANYCDPSGIRNSLALNCGKMMDDIKNETTDCVLVEVVLNGKYLGVYNLVEQIEINKNRVDITKDSPLDDTGFIVEMDGRAPDEGVKDKDYFVMYGREYAIKDPDTDDELTEGQMSFIKKYFYDCYGALTSNNYENVKKFIDVDTFASNYIIQELFKSVDVGWLSFYFYKDAGGKLCNGPLWDFDISTGNCNYNYYSTCTDNLFAKGSNVWFNLLLSYPEFRNLVSEKVVTSSDLLRKCINDTIEDAYNSTEGFYRNFNTWKTIGTYVWPNPDEIVNIKTWEGNVEYVRDWLLESLSFIEQTYSPA